MQQLLSQLEGDGTKQSDIGRQPWHSAAGIEIAGRKGECVGVLLTHRYPTCGLGMYQVKGKLKVVLTDDPLEPMIFLEARQFSY